MYIASNIMINKQEERRMGGYSMDFLDLAKNRYSERRFDNRPIEEEKLARILEAGRVAPTGANNQPQRIFVLKSQAALEKARSVTPYTFGAPLVLLVCYDSEVVWWNPNDRLIPYYNCGEQDASIAATNMMYAAEEQGIHTLWVRGFDAKSVAEVFELPEEIVPVMMLVIGYPTEKSKAHPAHYRRIPLSEMVKEL